MSSAEIIDTRLNLLWALLDNSSLPDDELTDIVAAVNDVLFAISDYEEAESA